MSSGSHFLLGILLGIRSPLASPGPPLWLRPQVGTVLIPFLATPAGLWGPGAAGRIRWDFLPDLLRPGSQWMEDLTQTPLCHLSCEAGDFCEPVMGSLCPLTVLLFLWAPKGLSRGRRLSPSPGQHRTLKYLPGHSLAVCRAAPAIL